MKRKMLDALSIIVSLSFLLASCSFTAKTVGTESENTTEYSHSLRTPTTKEEESISTSSYLIGEKKANIMMRRRPTPMPTPEPTDSDGNRVIDYYNKDDRKKANIRFDRDSNQVTTTTMKETSQLTTTTTPIETTTTTKPNKTTTTKAINSSNNTTKDKSKNTTKNTSKNTTKQTTSKPTKKTNTTTSKDITNNAFQISSGLTFKPLKSGTVVEQNEKHLYWRNEKDQFRSAISELIYKGLLNRQETIDLSSVISKYTFKEDPINVISILVFSIKDTDPRFFFYEQQFSYNYYYVTNADKSYTFTQYYLNFKYQKRFDTVAKQKEMWNKMNATAWQFANEIKEQTTDLIQMYKLVHDKLARYSYYSPSMNRDMNNAYGALIDTETMCVGYSLAFQMIANRLGGNAITIYGYAGTEKDGDYHNWNMVKAGNNWYHVDVTWDDNSTIGDFSSKNSDNLAHPFIAWFMRSDKGAHEHKVYSYARPQASNDYEGVAKVANNKVELKNIIAEFFSQNKPNAKLSIGTHALVKFKLTNEELSQLIYDAYYASGVDYSCVWVPFLSNGRMSIQLLPYS